MAWRKVIRIDEAKCDGCGECVTGCAEGAIAITNGKARLVSEVYCDGLGACLGHCPQGAISMEEWKNARRRSSTRPRHASISRASGMRRRLQTRFLLPLCPLRAPARWPGASVGR